MACMRSKCSPKQGFNTSFTSFIQKQQVQFAVQSDILLLNSFLSFLRLSQLVKQILGKQSLFFDNLSMYFPEESDCPKHLNTKFLTVNV